MRRFGFVFAAVVLVAFASSDPALAAPTTATATKAGPRVRRQVVKPKPKRMFLKRVRGQRLRDSQFGNTIKFLRGRGLPVPEILYLFEYNPSLTAPWQEYSQEVMRSQSGLPATQRELIAAVVSQGNECGF